MRQQINLLQNELIERKPALPAEQLIAVLLITLLVAAASVWWMNARAVESRANTSQLEARLATTQETVLQLTQAMTPIEADPRLDARLKQIEQELEHLQAITQVAGGLTRSRPLSEFVAGFGRQRPEGLWLSFLHVGQAGSNLVLEGHVVNAALLPDYIAGLGTEPAFEGLRFGQLSLERHDEAGRWLDFRIIAGCSPGDCPAADGDTR